jgi:phosphoribosylanthranilate isomerase
MTPARTRIKICGLREPEHALLAAREGADAIGLVFHAASPRNVDLDTAARIASALPAFVQAVGLFVDAPAERVREVLSRVKLDMLQFQGNEGAEYCGQFGLPYLRAVRMEEGVDLVEYGLQFPLAKALLLDAFVPGTPGGSGHTFDWTRIPPHLPLPFVLSGGLHAGNVAQAIRAARPWAVDVSSGVESARGVKDPAKIVEFIRTVQRETLRPS